MMAYDDSEHDDDISSCGIHGPCCGTLFACSLDLSGTACAMSWVSVSVRMSDCRVVEIKQRGA